MPANRPFVLTIAGLDPTAGAGILSDIKTFENHRTQGFAVNTANTIQTENVFYELQWSDIDFVLQSLQILLENYEFKAVKIGIVPSLDYLSKIVAMIRKHAPLTVIIWDTVLKSSTAFSFLTIESQTALLSILKQLDVITPNYDEMQKMQPFESNPEATAKALSKYCSIVLKGGHNPNEKGTDYLYMENSTFEFPPENSLVYPKHGSGCVFSAALAANIALGLDIKTACRKAKGYTEKYLISNKTLIGYHYV